MQALDRCRQEVAQARAMLLAGEPHEDELVVWWADANRELRRLEAEEAAAGLTKKARQRLPAGRCCKERFTS